MDARNFATILVTGVGDTVGQALVKAARKSEVPCRILGTDRDDHAAGFAWVDRASVLPHCTQRSAYVDEVRRICASEGVQLIFPGSEVELEVLSECAETLRRDLGVIVMANPPEVLRIALDKWETCRFLERVGLNFPRYARADDSEAIEKLIETVGFPLFAKPCHGTGSRGARKIHGRTELEDVRASGAGMVLEEYLTPEEEEYSIAVYTPQSGEPVGTICYRRGQMVAGDTYKAKVMAHPAAEAEALAVGRTLGARGPCNIQLRVTERGPVTFEINPRFSGGVSIRAHFGYNEVEMAIRDRILKEPLPAPRVRSGFAVRYWEELILEEDPNSSAMTPRFPSLR